jgi:hypothetical protein
MDMCREKMIVKTYHQSSSFAPKTYEKRSAAGASPQTPLGKLTALPRPPSWLKGMGGEENGREGEGRERRGRGGKEGEGEGEGKGREGRGSSVPIVPVLRNDHWAPA